MSSIIYGKHSRSEVQELFPNLKYGSIKMGAAWLLMETIAAKPMGSRKDCVETTERTSGHHVGTSLVYSRNAKTHWGAGYREPKPQHEQEAAFRRDLFLVYDEAKDAAAVKQLKDKYNDKYELGERDEDVLREYSSGAGQSQGEQGEDESESESDGKGQSEQEKDEQEQQAAEQEQKQQRQKDPVTRWFDWSREVARPFCQNRDADGQPLDHWGYRKTFDGGALCKVGIPFEAVQDAATMDWPEDARHELKIKTFDYDSFGILDYMKLAATAKSPTKQGMRHVPMMLIGPAGVAKTSFCEVLADELGVEYGFSSLTYGTPPSEFYGRVIAIGGETGKIQESIFEQVLTNGGVHVFDELDGADPNIIKIVNAPIANGRFANPLKGKVINAHENWLPIATANTMGTGADREYVGRERQDRSVIDRFACGRIRVGINEDFEAKVYAEKVEA